MFLSGLSRDCSDFVCKLVDIQINQGFQCKFNILSIKLFVDEAFDLSPMIWLQLVVSHRCNNWHCFFKLKHHSFELLDHWIWIQILFTPHNIFEIPFGFCLNILGVNFSEWSLIPLF